MTAYSAPVAQHRLFTIILILFFLGSRLLFFFLEQDNFLYRLPQQDDAPAYLQLSAVYAGLATYDSVRRSPFTRVPLYPIFLSFFAFIPLSARLLLVFILQQFLQLLIILSVWFYLRRHHSLRLAFVASLLLLLFYDFAIYGFLVRSETLFTALVVLSCLLFIQAVSRRRLGLFFLSAFFFSQATLTRPVAALVVFPLILLTILSSLPLRVNYRDISLRCFLILVGYAFPLLPWLYHNYALSGTLLLQQDTGNLIHTTVPGGHWGSVDIHQLVDTASMTELEADRALTKIALARIKDNPSIWLKNTLNNFSWRLWSMGFAGTYLRYLNHTAATAVGAQPEVNLPLWQRLLASWSIFNVQYDIHPLYHLYFVLNNLLGLLITFLPLLGLILFPFLPSPRQIIFVWLLYFWIFSSFFAFSGSRYMVPFLPLLWLVVPAYPSALKKLFHSFHYASAS